MNQSSIAERERALARVRALAAKTTANGCTEAEAQAAATTYEITLDETAVREDALVGRVIANKRQAERERKAQEEAARRRAKAKEAEEVWRKAEQATSEQMQEEIEAKIRAEEAERKEILRREEEAAKEAARSARSERLGRIMMRAYAIALCVGLVGLIILFR